MSGLMSTLPRIAAATALAFGLAACSNDPDFESPVNVVGNVYDSLFSEDSAPSPVTQEAIVATLSATPLPVVFINLEERSSQSLFTRIESNQGYDTFASLSRQSIIMRNGKITGTRGIGGDLMSSEVGPLMQAVTSGATTEQLH